MAMYLDVERLQGTLRDLGGLVNEPDSLPDVTRDYIEVCAVQYVSMATMTTFTRTVCIDKKIEGEGEGGRERGEGGEVNYKIHHYSPLEYIYVHIVPDQRKALLIACPSTWEIDQIGCIVCSSHVYVAL